MVNSGIGMTVSSSYTISRTNTSNQSRFIWELGGWGPCSASCAGGKRQRTVACRDQFIDKVVPRRKCPLSEKPVLMVQDCNTFR